jgi:1,4-alpha-glucan branching enzyme
MGTSPKRPKAGKAKKISKEASKTKAAVAGTGIKKQYFKTKDTCKVTFRVPLSAAMNASSISLVGDFNDWSIHANPLKRLKGGDYTISLELARGGEYQFRYLIDGTRWENDWQADKYVKNPYGDSDNSVIIV